LLACGRTNIEACAWQACDEAPSSSAEGGKAGAHPGSSVPVGGVSAAVAGAPTVAAGAGFAAVGGGGTSSRGEGGGAFDQSDAPIVLLLLDGSTSMYDPPVWTPTFEALTGPDGPLARFQDRVRFGFVSYRGAGESTEDDPACAELTSVGFALENAPPIRAAYAELGNLPRWPPWETPTGHALGRVIPALLAESESVAKYILLISDGAPDTCATTNPQCGQDRAVFAVQQAFQAGIETRAIGVGFGFEYPGCSVETARCGSDHFQDVANAGQGLRVVAPPDGYVNLPCILETGGQLLASYSPQGDHARYYWTKSAAEVAAAVTEVLQEIVRR
jgi:hypothetical protein